jgi:hypothetical protein
MSFPRTAGAGRLALCAIVLGGVLAGPVAGASASDASIKAVIKSFNSKILVAEGHVVSAIGEFKKSGDPSKAQNAIAESIAVLGALKSKIASQSASSPKVKLGKVKFDKGLQSVIVAYRHLKAAFGEKKVSPKIAKAEAKKAVLEVNKGRIQLREGAKLLS